nr:DEAD/DEAH box helicase [uncultured Treponema sp.]
MISISDFQNSFTKSEPAGTNADNQEKFFGSIDFDKQKRAFFSFTTVTKDSRIAAACFSGINREVVELYLKLTKKNAMSFSWLDEELGKLYLDENPYFTDLLFKSDFEFVSGGKTPLSFAKNDEKLNVTLKIEKDDIAENKDETETNSENTDSKNFFELSVLVDGEKKKFKPLTQDFVIIDKTIFHCQNLGSQYRQILKFNGTLTEENLSSVLTLFVSNFPQIEIFSDTLSLNYAEQKKAEPTIQFHSVDEEGTLNLRFFWSLENFSPDFVSQFYPEKAAVYSKELKSVSIFPVVYDNFYFLVNYQNMLSQVAKKYQLENTSVFSENSVFIGKELAAAFLTEKLSYLSQNFRLFGTDALKKFKLKVVSPKVNFNLKSGINFFESLCDVEIGEQKFSFEDAISLYEKNNFIPLNDGSKAIIDKGFFQNLKKILGKKDKAGNYKISFFDLPFIQQILDAKVSGEGFETSRKIFEGFNSINENQLASCELNGKLRNYQSYGVKWMSYLAKNNLGGCLADDMGLGKTVQVIALLNQMRQENPEEFDSKPSIIIVPKSLISNWESEFKHFAPEFDLFVYYGADRNIEEISKHQIIITTYAVTRIDIEKLQEIEFNFAILDEIQAIKNTVSQVTKAVMLLNANHRFGLSGTPMENHLGELYSIFRFINPPMFGSVNDFNEKYLNPIQKDGDQQAAKQLSSKLNPFILRRLKKEVAKELPDKTEQILYVELSDEQRKLYESRREYFEKVITKELEGQKGKEGLGNAGFVVLQGLTELRQLASCPESKTDGQIQSSKWDVLISGLTELAENGHKCLVFTNFISCIESISQQLEENGIEHLVMTGATNNRSEIVKKFKTDSRYKVFLMTLKTGGVGLNLTEADYVYIIDPWWNTSAEQQAIDRTHRIGQTKNVFCYRMIAKNTIEEKILELQNRKKDLFAQVISSDTQLMKKLTVEDIDYLLKK